MKWIRYRFLTKATEDYRPLIFNPRFPWWCSGIGGHETAQGEQGWHATIIVWLPEGEDLLKYWDDAYEITSEQKDRIEFTDRFSKPYYFVES